MNEMNGMEVVPKEKNAQKFMIISMEKQ